MKQAKASPKSLRIAMLSIHSSPLGPLGSRDTGGMSVYIRELARRLGAMGHHIDIFTYSRGRDAEMTLYPNVRLVHLAQSLPQAVEKNQLPLHLNTVFEALEQYRTARGRIYDLVHSHYWLSGVVGAMAQTRWRCPHLTMFHTLGAVKNTTASMENEPDLRIAHEHWIAKVADRIVVPTDGERDNLLHYYHAPAERVVTIPCGVDLERFRPGDGNAVRSRLNIPPEADVVLFVGRFAPLKGIDLLIEATADLKDRFPDLHLLVVGGDGADAQSTRSLQQTARDLGVFSRVTFAGRIGHRALPAFYSAADLLALPSHYESFGLVVLESLACGTPVAATPVGIAATVVQSGFNGERMAGPQRGFAADGLARFFSQPRASRPCGAAIRTTVIPYAWSAVAAHMAETYAAVLDSHDPERAPLFYTAQQVIPN